VITYGTLLPQIGTPPPAGKKKEVGENIDFSAACSFLVWNLHGSVIPVISSTDGDMSCVIGVLYLDLFQL